MRPRVFPAEDHEVGRHVAAPVQSFNEAAGIPRGRPFPTAILGTAGQSASMRPRVFPAEDAWPAVVMRTGVSSGLQ